MQKQSGSGAIVRRDRRIYWLVLALVAVLAVPILWLAADSPDAPVAASPDAEAEGAGLDQVQPLGTVTVSLNPSSKTTYPNSNFDVQVLIAAGSNQVTSADIHLAFDPEYLRVTSATTAGPSFPATAANQFDNAAGTIDFGAYIPGSSVTGNVVLCTLHLRALKLTPGTPTLITTRSFSGAPNGLLVVGPGGVQHTANWASNGRVTIVTPPPTNTPANTATPTSTPTVEPAQICVAVYEEKHDNYVREGDEPLLAGAVLQLLNLQRTPVASYTTDGINEPHCFAVSANQLYILDVTSPPGFTAAGPDTAFVVAPAAYTLALDFGQVPAGVQPTHTPTPTVTPSADYVLWLPIIAK